MSVFIRIDPRSRHKKGRGRSVTEGGNEGVEVQRDGMCINAQAATCIDREGGNSIVVWIGVKDRLLESP